ncbi:zf-TFIIB domain-containing protein [Geomobilimonas luticola]|uniref:Zf-TFIIB domain-containing protein n=1 Tax=Geomobilimonas luticola TaxID=1114878 RepID=A0ABS5SDW1_9BACT|nr:zf-TFIIB domain-containing protein [Geomobilimonas luticola]
MANCTNCSAPLPPDSIRCDYCGSRNDIDLKGVHYYTTHEVATGRTCPRCNVGLTTIDLKLDGRFLIERCDECLGLFFDPGELEALLEATVTNVFAVDRSRLDTISTARRSNDYGVSYVKCPVCAKIMNRINFGTKSGVIVDRCKEHGVWLDGGELRHLFEWMKAGGKLLDQERQEERKKAEAEREREERNRIARIPEGNYPENPIFDDYGSILRAGDPELFHLIRKAIAFFTR